MRITAKIMWEYKDGLGQWTDSLATYGTCLGDDGSFDSFDIDSANPTGFDGQFYWTDTDPMVIGRVVTPKVYGNYEALLEED